MTHGDAVVNSNGVEFFSNSAGRLNFSGDHLTEILEMNMSRHELGKGIGDRDNWLFEIIVCHSRRTP